MYKKVLLKRTALAMFLAAKDLDTLTVSPFDDSVFTAGEGEYLVLTDGEAKKRVSEYIRENVWAFRADFLLTHTKLPQEALGMIQIYQEKCEDANEGLTALVTNMNCLIRDAIALDGRGHFLSPYDGKEHEEEVILLKENRKVKFYIYRLN